MLPIAPDSLLQQRYRILKILSEGEFGRIYLATDIERDEARCAIEEITPSSQFPNTVARAKELFKQEAALLYQLDRPQLPRFWTIFEEVDRIFLVRDYIPGKTYGELLAHRRANGSSFSESDVWRFLMQMLPVLGYIHSKGIVHRNISPDRIVCRDRDLLPVPIDFGVVREFATKLQASPVSQIHGIGQPGYAPIEQLQEGRVYPNSDLYALAVTAIVLLTGKEPSALFADGQMTWDWRKWVPISDEFAAILKQMLATHPQDRYQSAIEAERALQNLQIASSDDNDPRRLSQLPTIVVGEKVSPDGEPVSPEGEPVAAPTPTRTATGAITTVHIRSIWEKPIVFVPVAISIALVAGLGSWFGVSHLLRNNSPTGEPVATTPPKQIDFNNPVINSTSSTDPTNPTSGDTAGDLIQPIADRAVVKEGNVDANTPVRYRIQAVAGQNLDIQLVTPTDPATAISSPISTISPSPANGTGNKTDPKSSTNPPIAIPNATPLAATQVLMTILSPTGNAIDEKADRVVGWRGQIPTAGDYTIELRPIKGLSGNAFPYKLSVTQLASLPTASPTTDAFPTVTPSADGTTPIDGSVPTATPADSSTDSTITPDDTASPIPIIVPTNAPTESTAPVRTRRTQTQTESSSQTRSRNRVSTAAETPTPRRRRRRVVSDDDSNTATSTPRRRRQVESSSSSEETPTPRRRRRRQAQTNSQPQSTPTSTPASRDNSSSSTPQPEPSIGIPVPPARNSSPSSAPAGNSGGDTE